MKTHGWLIFLLVLLFPALLCGQTDLYTLKFAPHFIHFEESDNGLPSNEVYHVIQDDKHNIWMATDRGLCKYNGQQFFRYGKKEGLGEENIYKLYPDDRGRIWAPTSDNTIFYLKDDIVYPYPYNDTLNKYLPVNNINLGFITDETDRIYIGLKNGNVSTVDSSGHFKSFDLRPFRPKANGTTQIVLEHHGQFLSHLLGHYHPSFPKDQVTNRILFIETTKDDSLNITKAIDWAGRTGHSRESHYIEKLDNGLFATLIHKTLVISDGDSLKELELPNFGIYTKRTGSILWVGLRDEGVIGLDLEDNYRLKHHFLNGNSITSICQDFQGGFWFSTLESGVFYTPNLDVQTLTFPDNQQNASAFTYQDQLLVGFDNGSIWYPAKGKLYKHDGPAANIIINIQYLESLKKWFVLGTQSEFIDFEGNRSPFKIGIRGSWYNAILERDGNILVATSSRLAKINPQGDLISEKTVEYGKRLKMVHYKEGVLIHCKGKGLEYFDMDTAYWISALTKAESKNIRDITKEGSKIFVLSENGTIHSFHDNTLEVIRESPNNSKSYYQILTRGDFAFLATSTGIEKVSFKTNQVEAIYNQASGLPSSRIRTFQLKQDSLFILTSDALTKIGINQTFKDPTPSISGISFAVNNKLLGRMDSTMVFNHDENQLEFNFTGNSFLPGEAVVYRYQLINEDKRPVITPNRSVRYTSLNPGKYTFMVGASTDGVSFSVPKAVSFVIEPPIWLRWWFITAEFIVGALSVFGLVLWRLWIVERKNYTARQILELRSSALRAQMNPHFTFNALNSIQSLVADDDSAGASIYLARFARLMRNALNASAHSSISLQDELEIVEHYLGLEKLRFKEAFAYTIDIDEDIFLNSVLVPPMLIQPLVENALKHGLLPTQRPGNIQINIRSKGAVIIIEVIDNGVGFSWNRSNKKQESKGLQITADRLRLFHKKNQFRVERLTNRDNQSIGTKALIVLHET